MRECEQEERGREVILEVGPLKSLDKDRIEPCVRRIMCRMSRARGELEGRPTATRAASPGELVVKAFEIVDRVKRGSGSHLERWKRYDGWRAKIRAYRESKNEGTKKLDGSTAREGRVVEGPRRSRVSVKVCREYFPF